MAVKIRMKRFGRTNRSFFRINAVDSRKSRDGRVIEELGSYDPHASDDQKVRLNAERVHYWLSVGAQPSDTVRTFLKKAGLIGPGGVLQTPPPEAQVPVAPPAPPVAAAPAVDVPPAPATDADAPATEADPADEQT